jgi:threonine/homoserine efflux transporter RhtA
MTPRNPTIAFVSDDNTDVFAALFPLIPLACGVAILRHRPYDIDRLVSRTVWYAVVTGLAFAVYLVTVTATTRPLPAQTSAWGVAAATLATATVSAFGRQLREVAEPDRVATGLVDAVRTTVGPAHVGLHLVDRTP